MKRIIYILAALFVGQLLVSCYGLEVEHYRELAKMTINNPDEVIDVNIGEEIVFDPQITSENDRPIEYEWYTRTQSGGSFKDSTMISTHPNIKYIPKKIGLYNLRLKADNGESIIFKDYKLNVNAGFDEGLMILSNDDQGKSSIVFIKKRSSQEIANNDQEIFDDVVSLINPKCEMTDAVDFHTNFRTEDDVLYCPLIVNCKDDNGSIHVFDRRTFNLIKTIKMDDEYPGVKPLTIGGDVMLSNTFGIYFIGSDQSLYRYDAITHKASMRAEGMGLMRSFRCTYNSKYYGYYTNGRDVFTITSGRVTNYDIPPGATFINMATGSGKNNKVSIITQDNENPNNYILRLGSTGLSSKSTVTKTVDPATVCIGSQSIMVCNSVNNDTYYNHNDKIYRWDFVNSADFPTVPVITPPTGESIVMLGTNLEGNQLYVLTYNENRVGKKGSLYIYSFEDHSLIKEYIGVCDKAVSIRYKENI